MQEPPQQDAPPPVRAGACLCGKIKYVLSGAAANPRYNTVCHCLNCRRATGSVMLTALICPKEGFEITQGAGVLRTYRDKFTDSGIELLRQFCGECGSNLFALTAADDSIVSVTAGTLDDFDSWAPDTEQYCIHRSSFIDEIHAVAPHRRFDEKVSAGDDPAPEDEQPQ